MIMLNALMGNASKIDNELLNTDFSWLLCEDEEFVLGYVLIRDMFIFTNMRLIFVDKQGITGSKMEIMSVPYKEITKFAVENAGTFEFDSDLKIWVKGDSLPIVKHFKKSVNIKEVYKLLSEVVL
jgi:hypothetical protein